MGHEPRLRSFLKPRACLDPNSYFHCQAKGTRYAGPKEVANQGGSQTWGRSPVKMQSSQRGTFHAACHLSSPQPCEQGAVIIILQMQGKEALRSQVTCLKSHSLFLVVPIFRQETFDLQAWPGWFYIQPPYPHHPYPAEDHWTQALCLARGTCDGTLPPLLPSC